MGAKLRLGISEDRDFAYQQIPGSALRSNGRYRSALIRLERLLDARSTRAIYSKYWDRCLGSGSTLPAATFEEAIERLRADMRWILIYEAEHARIWKDGPLDYMTALRNYKQSAKEDSARIKKAIEELRRFDRRHAYLLRHAFDHALQDFLSDEKVRKIKMPNQNADRGFEWRMVSGPQVRQHEFQYLSRLSLFRFDDLLDSWEREIDNTFRDWPAHWMEFGSLRFNRPISKVAAAKLNVPQLGLIARLTSRLRDFTAGYGLWSYATGQPVPTHGKPHWEIVAEFVNCALELPNPLTGDTARRIWQSVASKHQITMQSWPRPPRSESQVDKTW